MTEELHCPECSTELSECSCGICDECEKFSDTLSECWDEANGDYRNLCKTCVREIYG